MKNNLFTKKLLVSIIITIVTTITVFGAEITFFGKTFEKVNLLLKDTLLFQGLFNTNTKFNDNIVIVEIDDKTLKDKEKGGLGRWQDFKRSYYAKAIDNMSKDGVAVIGMDILFSEESTDSKEDELFRDSLKRNKNVILAYHYLNKLYPIEILKDAALGIGDIRPFINEINNTIYSTIAHYIDNSGVNETFGISVLRAYDSIINGNEFKIDKSTIKDNYFILNNEKIDYSGYDYKNLGTATVGKEFLINYIPNISSIKKYSFVDIYKGNYKGEDLNGKIILIGADATALHDEFISPILTDQNGVIPGVYFHALLINTIMNNKFIYYLNFYKEIIIFIIFIFLISVFSSLFDSKYNKYIYISGIIFFPLIYITVYISSFKFGNLIFRMPMVFITGIMLATIMGIIYRYFYEDKGKRILKDALAQYVSSELAEEILEHYEEVKLKEGSEKDIVIFFSDIEGFTNISENLETKELFAFIRDYLKEMSDVIIDNKGHINKYEGDAIMALWGNFNDLPGKEKYACLTAINQIKKLEEMNKRYKESYGFEIRIRIGINTGNAKVGNIGSEGSKLEFTALGDNVNLASRLEGINKFYGSKICVSESTKNKAGDEFLFRFLDEIKVKGKNKSVKIYELIGLKNEINKDLLDLIKNFEIALGLYRERKFEEALNIFQKISELQDKPSNVFYLRCKEFILNNPGENWHGVYEFSEK